MKSLLFQGNEAWIKIINNRKWFVKDLTSCRFDLNYICDNVNLNEPGPFISSGLVWSGVCSLSIWWEFRLTFILLFSSTSTWIKQFFYKVIFCLIFLKKNQVNKIIFCSQSPLNPAGENMSTTTGIADPNISWSYSIIDSIHHVS